MFDTCTVIDFSCLALFKDPKINETTVEMVGGFQSISIFILWRVQLPNIKSSVEYYNVIPDYMDVVFLLVALHFANFLWWKIYSI